MRPEPYSKHIKSLIKKEFDKLINEIFDSKIKTDYETIKKTFDGFNVEAYRFESKNHNQYDLEFLFNVQLTDFRLDNGEIFSEYLNSNIKYFETVDIAFTLSERIKNDDNIEHKEYTRNTEYNEQLDVLGRIVYLVDVFINEHPEINVYVIGRNTHKTKINAYKKMFSNIFSSQFIMFEGESIGYSEGAIYFINEKIIK